MFFKSLFGYLKQDIGRLGSAKKQVGKFMKHRNDHGSDNNVLSLNADSAERSTPLIILLKRKYLIISLTVLVLIILSTFFAIQNSNTVSTIMSLNYAEGSKGLNPNSTRFNMYELRSHEVMERAIQYMGLSGQLTPEELAENVMIENSNPMEIGTDENSYFISTSFRVTYTRNSGVKDNISTSDMLSMICKAYNDIFHERYGDKRSALVYSNEDISDKEYVEIGDDMQLQASRMQQYLQQRVSENGGFRSEETGETFQTLKKMIDNLLTYDIARYKSYILETGIAKNKAEFIQTLYYNNSVLDKDYQRSMAEYAVRQDAISRYDEVMIGTVMIPSVNERQDYYMSRANIGIDYLARDAETHLSNAKSILKQIEINNDIIYKLSLNVPTEAGYQVADQMINDIIDKFEEISELSMLTDRDYISYKTKDYLTFAMREPSIAEKISLTKSLVLSVLFMLALCAVVYGVDKHKTKARGIRL